MPWKNLKRFWNKFFKQPLYALRVLFKRSQAYFFYYFVNGRSSLPEAITLFLTHRCNLRCKMCGQWGEGGVTKDKSAQVVKSELPFETFKKLVDDISGFSPNITLFGGEPLLYPDCVELIRYIKSKKMHCLMISNGALIKGKAKELVDSGLDELNISLDGAAGLHNSIRGLPGLFEKITDGLKDIAEYKKSRKLKNTLINLQCTITKYNYEHLEELINVANDVHADSLTYHNLIFLGQDLIEKQKAYDEKLQCSSKDWEGFVFAPGIEPERLFNKMRQILAGKYSFNVDFYPNLSLNGLKEYYNNISYLPSEYPKRCLSPWIVAYVFPDGEVRPCLNSSFSFGNIRENKGIGSRECKKL
ncbi:MAG: radical SAM protein [Candidatus Omnitrophica bacterium]|nr:radical SAM protein [Candidatus Omnitrophota bacterium]